MLVECRLLKVVVVSSKVGCFESWSGNYGTTTIEMPVETSKNRYSKQV